MGKVKEIVTDMAEQVAVELNISIDAATDTVGDHGDVSATLDDILNAIPSEEVKIARAALTVFRKAFWAAKDNNDHEEAEHLGAITDGLTEFLMRHDPDHAREMARQNDADLKHIVGE